MSSTRREFVQGGVALMGLPRLHRHPSETNQDEMNAEELWYLQPADRWLQALPIGNGRIGGMIFGDPHMERVALSESTVWSGKSELDQVNPGALAHLHEMRELFFARKYGQMQELCSKYLPGKMNNFGTNLPLPELQFQFDNQISPSNYRRSLNLDQAIARVTFRNEGAIFRREFLASHPDGILAFHFTCSLPEQISFRMQFGETDLPSHIHYDQENTLTLRGRAYEHLHSNGKAGVAFQISAHIIHEGGMVTGAGQSLQVSKANTVTVLVAVGTSFRGGKPEQACHQNIRRAAGKSFQLIRQAHRADHQSLYRRLSINLGPSSPSSRRQPTNVRRQALEQGAADPELIALFFQYGRYLTIAGSRADSPLPLALQGIWNDGRASSMGWTDDFHLDINTEQNYWPAEVCNLSECQMPLFGLIELMRTAGSKTAREMYGAPGWVVHTVTNPWGYTAPGGIGWGVFVTAGLWIALQMWDHYTFNVDTDFLRNHAYPVLREAAEFFLAYMVKDPNNDWLVTGPSVSPENWYVTSEGSHAADAMGNTVDRVLVHALCSMCIEASKILRVDEDLHTRLKQVQAKLPPFQIGSHGQLQEWMLDFKEAIPNQRHTSHLIALYPEHQISPRTTPKLARAAEVTIQRRMHAAHWQQTEWGFANLIAYYARLLKGDDAYQYLTELIGKSSDDNLLTFSIAGVAGATQNIFALDGNTAGTAAIAEMLLQSQANEIELLPALPTAWPTGSIRGLCARGGYVVDIEWHGGTLTLATITSRRGGITPVRYRNKRTTLHSRPGQATHLRPENFIETA